MAMPETRKENHIGVTLYSREKALEGQRSDPPQRMHSFSRLFVCFNHDQIPVPHHKLIPEQNFVGIGERKIDGQPTAEIYWACNVKITFIPSSFERTARRTGHVRRGPTGHVARIGHVNESKRCYACRFTFVEDSGLYAYTFFHIRDLCEDALMDIFDVVTPRHIGNQFIIGE